MYSVGHTLVKRLLKRVFAYSPLPHINHHRQSEQFLSSVEISISKHTTNPSFSRSTLNWKLHPLAVVWEVPHAEYPQHCSTCIHQADEECSYCFIAIHYCPLSIHQQQEDRPGLETDSASKRWSGFRGEQPCVRPISVTPLSSGCSLCLPEQGCLLAELPR